MIGNSFNSDTSLWGCAAPLRLSCINQVAGTFGRLACRFKIPHRGGVSDRVDEVRNTLRITGTYAERFAAAAEQMLGTPMPEREIVDFVAALMPTPGRVKSAAGADRWAARRGQLADLIRKGENNTVGRGTRFAAYNGATELADHCTAASSLSSRYKRIVDGGDVERFKTRAANLLLAGV